jgi:hypothetical protein
LRARAAYTVKMTVDPPPLLLLVLAQLLEGGGLAAEQFEALRVELKMNGDMVQRFRCARLCCSPSPSAAVCCLWWGRVRACVHACVRACVRVSNKRIAVCRLS